MKRKKEILVTKASGEKAPFHEDKLRASLMRSGADVNQTEQILSEISSQLYQGISTKKIYRIAFNLLKSGTKPFAARYQLKQGIMELGPSGYPFEKFVGEILSHQGYSVQVGQIVKGKCVNHEVDVIALADHHHFMIECKYHNQRGTVCDVKIPLYIQSRFKDVEAEWIKIPGHANRTHQGWVVTNTKFTTDAIQYGNCCGLKLLGWDYPVKGSLKDLIDEFGLYPITCLTTLTRAEKQQLLDMKIVLCKEICNNTKLLSDLGMNEIKIGKVTEEGQKLCNSLINHGKH
ncbi:MAG: restriction endonuclease [Bacteroidia bacterium]|jgi:hypothetical protein|nr:restriction endonuclease [Bacteroidia bacterium]